MSRGGARHGRAGFTLIETIVTIVVTGVVVLLGYAAFTTLIDRRSQMRGAMADTERAAALRATLESWFARSYVQGPGASRGNVGSADVGSGDQDMLGFATRAPNPSTAWAAHMLLFIDNNPATPEQGLTVRYLPHSSGESVPWLTFSNSEPAQTEDEQLRRARLLPAARELDRAVTGLRVEWLDRKTNRWVRDLNGVTIDPVAARVTLEGPPSAPLPPLLQLPFLITQRDGWAPRS